MKSARIRSFSGPLFSAYNWIRRDTPYWIRMRENMDQNTAVYEHFSRSVSGNMSRTNIGASAFSHIDLKSNRYRYFCLWKQKSNFAAAVWQYLLTVIRYFPCWTVKYHLSDIDATATINTHDTKLAKNRCSTFKLLQEKYCFIGVSPDCSFVVFIILLMTHRTTDPEEVHLFCAVVFIYYWTRVWTDRVSILKVTS